MLLLDKGPHGYELHVARLCIEWSWWRVAALPLGHMWRLFIPRHSAWNMDGVEREHELRFGPISVTWWTRRHSRQQDAEVARLLGLD